MQAEAVQTGVQGQDYAVEADGVTWLLAEHAFPLHEQQARERAARFMGGVALRGTLGGEQQPERPNDTTLLANIQRAALGDSQAAETVRTNVITDMAERMYKAGHQTEVHLQIDGGRLSQGGVYLSDLTRNTLEHTVLNDEMLCRTKTELKNAFLFESLLSQGVLDTYDAVVFSPTSTDERTRQDYNFFTDTDTCSIQWLRADGEGAVLQTALVAGKTSPTAERHDVGAIQAMAVSNGIELAVNDASELLQYVMLVPKQTVPHGVCDIVAQYDAVNGTFYGEAIAPQDYEMYAATCHQRNERFNDQVADITQQLLAEAATFTSPLQAMKRLDALSERFCVEYAVQDSTIKAAVFGPEAAYHLEQARLHYLQGDHEQAQRSQRRAQQTARSSSCPWLKSAVASQFNGSDSGAENASASDEESSKKKEMNCPFCSAKVFDDPCAVVLSCWDCHATVSNGRVVNTGNGGSKKRAEEKAKRVSEQAILRKQKEDEALQSSQEDDGFSQAAAELIEQEDPVQIPAQAALTGV